ncbi:L-galactono-1,4-lactone dehydrogenase, mitochondrial isoform X2 [Lingula anatina]|uniref:L-galactono-1,4-lactone dehydrogenase, mitochondrial isoform X2 n=1 Tax=Lingula anatina TaxID=7574 RepID=A0A1S3H1K3_LINAN|nr:L-galactono-1,4-lactone dehydrogenase, mitochondrial isoform X2 [Lingula anatina]|eukprot:XP_013379361.1 L-galactono-1,4-lactone dehydrogenase, mitochondrial isoform X2 [Lingula anatina]
MDLLGVLLWLCLPARWMAGAVTMTRKVTLVQRSLQNIVGSSPKIEVKSFENWAESLKEDVVFTASPKSVREIQRIVFAALLCRKNVRVVGSTHSWSSLFTDSEQIQINLGNMTLEGGKRVILQPGEYPGYRTVRIAPGVTVGELNDLIVPLGFTLRSGPSIKEATVLGAIATSSHGAMVNEPAIGGYMTGARFVDGWGKILAFNEDTDPEVLKALRCNLGLLGVVFEFELKIFPQEQVNSCGILTPLKTLFNPEFLRNAVSKNNFVLILSASYSSLTEKEARSVLETGKVPTTWDSGNDIVLINIVDPDATPDSLNTSDDPLPEDVTVVSTGQEFYKFIKGFPRALKGINLTDAIYLDTAVLGPKFLASEYTFPEKTDFKRSANALKEFSRFMNEKSHTEGILPFTRFVARWVKGTDCFLCPTSNPTSLKVAGDAGHFTTLGMDGVIDTLQEGPGFSYTMHKLVEAWDNLGLEGTLHWGKITEVTNFKEKIKTYFRHDLGFFENIRRKIDPHGVFMNDYLSYLYDAFNNVN